MMEIHEVCHVSKCRSCSSLPHPSLSGTGCPHLHISAPLPPALHTHIHTRTYECPLERASVRVLAWWAEEATVHRLVAPSPLLFLRLFISSCLGCDGAVNPAEEGGDGGGRGERTTHRTSNRQREQRVGRDAWTRIDALLRSAAGTRGGGERRMEAWEGETETATETAGGAISRKGMSERERRVRALGLAASLGALSYGNGGREGISWKQQGNERREQGGRGEPGGGGGRKVKVAQSDRGGQRRAEQWKGGGLVFDGSGPCNIHAVFHLHPTPPHLSLSHFSPVSSPTEWTRCRPRRRRR